MSTHSLRYKERSLTLPSRDDWKLPKRPDLEEGVQKMEDRLLSLLDIACANNGYLGDGGKLLEDLMGDLVLGYTHLSMIKHPVPYKRTKLRQRTGADFMGEVREMLMQGEDSQYIHMEIIHHCICEANFPTAVYEALFDIVICSALRENMIARVCPDVDDEMREEFTSTLDRYLEKFEAISALLQKGWSLQDLARNIDDKGAFRYVLDIKGASMDCVGTFARRTIFNLNDDIDTERAETIADFLERCHEELQSL